MVPLELTLVLDEDGDETLQFDRPLSDLLISGSLKIHIDTKSHTRIILQRSSMSRPRRYRRYRLNRKN